MIEGLNADIHDQSIILEGMLWIFGFGSNPIFVYADFKCNAILLPIFGPRRPHG